MRRAARAVWHAGLAARVRGEVRVAAACSGRAIAGPSVRAEVPNPVVVRFDEPPAGDRFRRCARCFPPGTSDRLDVLLRRMGHDV